MPQEQSTKISDTDAVGSEFRLWRSGGSFRAALATLMAMQSGLTFVNGILAGFTGLKFPAVQVPSADPNTLDDYEEGVWTPSFGTGGVQFTTVGYSAQQGIYVKIGALVYVFGHMTVNALTVGAASGTLLINGQPFNAAVFGAPLVIGFITGFTLNTPIAGAIAGTQIALYHRVAITTGSVQTTFAALSATSDIYFGGVYSV